MDQRNLLLAIVLSVAILFGFQMVFPPAQPPVQTQAQRQRDGGVDQDQQRRRPDLEIGQLEIAAAQACVSRAPFTSRPSGTLNS